MITNKISNNIKIDTEVICNPNINIELQMSSIYHITCYDSNGNLKWEEYIENIVVNVGLNDLLDKYFKGSGYTASFFIGLKGTGTIASGDTMASHAGWSTITPYSNANDPALTLGSVSGQSVNNTASKASYTIDATATVAGAFIKDNNTKGSSTGLLYGGADFPAARGVADGDTMNVEIILSAVAG